MAKVKTIRQLLCQTVDKLSAAEQNKTVIVSESGEHYSLQQLLHRVQRLSAIIGAEGHASWLLACDSTSAFLEGFLALMLAGKTIVLPANDKPGTLKEMSAYGESLLTDGEGAGFSGTVYKVSDAHIIDDQCPALRPEKIAQAKLVFFTSGSSGSAKPVLKTVQQLEHEALALESLWGERVEDSAVLTCVSHQHMYGLTFHLVWPLLTGRLISAGQLEYPEWLLEGVVSFQRAALVMSPAQLSRLPEDMAWQSIRDRISVIFSSGAPLMAEHARKTYHNLGQYPLEVFGSTETGAVAWRQQKRWVSGADEWALISGVTAQRSGKQLQVHSSWLEQPETGFVMGDNVRFTQAGRFVLMGRADKIVKIEGKRVSLTEVQHRLKGCDWVKEAEVLLLETGRAQLGAVVVLSAEGELYLASRGKLALSRLIKQSLGDYLEAVTLPRKWRYVQQMPINSQGKIVRQALKDLFN